MIGDTLQTSEESCCKVGKGVGVMPVAVEKKGLERVQHKSMLLRRRLHSHLQQQFDLIVIADSTWLPIICVC